VLMTGIALSVMALVKCWNVQSAGEFIIHVVQNLTHQSLCVRFAR